MADCNAVSTPVVNSDYNADSSNDQRPEMEAREARLYRSAAAIANYLAQDRPDLSVASCLLARSMASPRCSDEIKLKRCLRYLKGEPVVPILFRWQPATESLRLWTDSDWATCRATRRSCSGGVVMRGCHLLSHWCRLQERIALSSGEAELLSGNRGLVNYVGLLNLLREIFDESFGQGQLVHAMDASAARSMVLRRGVGTLKHLEVRDLWSQEITRRLAIDVEKIPREENFADALASASSRGDLARNMESLGVELSQTA